MYCQGGYCGTAPEGIIVSDVNQGDWEQVSTMDTGIGMQCEIMCEEQIGFNEQPATTAVTGYRQQPWKSQEVCFSGTNECEDIRRSTRPAIERIQFQPADERIVSSPIRAEPWKPAGNRRPSRVCGPPTVKPGNTAYPSAPSAPVWASAPSMSGYSIGSMPQYSFPVDIGSMPQYSIPMETVYIPTESKYQEQPWMCTGIPHTAVEVCSKKVSKRSSKKKSHKKEFPKIKSLKKKSPKKSSKKKSKRKSSSTKSSKKTSSKKRSFKKSGKQSRNKLPKRSKDRIITCENISDMRDYIESEDVVFVDFMGQFCHPCKELMPTYTKLAKKYSEDAHFLKVNITNTSNAIEEYSISTIPTFKVFVEGEEVYSVTSPSKEELKKMVKKHI